MYIRFMDLWNTIGVISSLFGIYSFLKNDTSLFSFFKKSIRIKKLFQNIKKPIFSFLEFVLKKIDFVVSYDTMITLKKTPILVASKFPATFKKSL